MGKAGEHVSDSWTQYWKTGADISCVANEGVDAQLRDLWNALVDELDENSRMLDLATGNGAVALNCLARAGASEKALHIDAVDAADINPENHQPKPGGASGKVHFHGGVRLEELPFDDGVFSAVVSQFGFEYADELPATEQAARVLSGGGRLCLVVHASNGAVSKDIEWRVKRLDAVLAKDGAVGRILSLLRAFEKSDAETLEKESARLSNTVALIECLAEDAPADDSALFYAKEFLRLWNTRNQHSSSELLRAAEKGWSDAAGTAIRQKQMLAAARSEDDVNRICRGFESCGLTMKPPEKIIDYHRNIQNAWLLRGRRN